MKVNFLIGLAVVLLSIGCTRAQANPKFRAGDRMVPAGQSVGWNFDGESAGTLPSGTSVLGGTWEIRKEPDAPSATNVLCQTGMARYPAVALGNQSFTDLDASVRFKPISGREDRAAGIIFRVQDQDNYYILRANALEDNVNFYRYSGGSRSLIQEGSAKVETGKWQELRVEVRGETMRGYLNGTKVVEATDTSFKAGGVGLWTKADSVTCFDDLQVTAR